MGESGVPAGWQTFPTLNVNVKDNLCPFVFRLQKGSDA